MYGCDVLKVAFDSVVERVIQQDLAQFRRQAKRTMTKAVGFLHLFLLGYYKNLHTLACPVRV